MTNKLTIAFTRREAELYRSHGLLEEARQLYRQVMDEAGTLGPSLAESLQEKIRKLEDELAELEVDLTDVVSERELCILRDGWGDAQSPSIEEYRKLIRLNQPFAEYIVGFTDSLLAVHTPETIKGEIDAIIDSDQPEEAHPTGLRIAFAMELSRRGLDRPSLALYEAAQAIKPLPKKIDALVTALQKRLQTKEAQAQETKLSPVSEKPGHQLRIRLAQRLARLRGLIRRLRKS